MRSSAKPVILLIALLLVVLIGCGQKGDLYLPEEEVKSEEEKLEKDS